MVLQMGKCPTKSPNKTHHAEGVQTAQLLERLRVHVLDGIVGQLEPTKFGKAIEGTKGQIGEAI